MSKILVLYVFHEMNNRVERFFKKCIFKDDNVDFIIISNGYNENLDLPSYVKVIRRNNKGFDFGGWSEGLLRDGLYKKYDYFIFANSSIYGTYIPDYYKDNWTSIFINGLKEDEETKLYGITINTERDPLFRSHVQSYFFCMDKSTLEFLINNEIFSLTNQSDNYLDCVQNKEILMSRLIINNGWNIGAICNYYKGVDFRFIKKQPHEYNMKFLCSIMDPQKKHIWNEYELVFVKGNRFKIN
jgi:lipopolysaccharide biosynthesis protein